MLDPMLDTWISVRPFVCYAQTNPLGFWNRVDWRALVKDKSPQMAKLKEDLLFFGKIFFSSKISDCLRLLEIFPEFFLRIWLDLTALLELRIPCIEKQRFILILYFFSSFFLLLFLQNFWIFWRKIYFLKIYQDFRFLLFLFCIFVSSNGFL